ncbi:MAG: hypothetical protein ACOC4Y_01775 [bacterium]
MKLPSFRFRLGKDDELKEWYESLPPGDRSREVRKILKKHIAGGQYPGKNKETKRKITPEKRSDKDNGNAEKKIDNLMGQF